MNQRCPDYQMLSVYLDGELPSPWKEKLESHVSGCAGCAGRLRAYRNNSLAGAYDDFETEAARQRVWRKLEPYTTSGVLRTPGVETARRRPVWRRNVSIPLPLAAAAILVFMALAAVMASRVRGPSENTPMILASEMDTPDIVPVSDMESVLQYVGGRDNGEIIIMRLPESRNFVNYGEPAIIRAADYSRQNMPARRMSNRNTPERRTPERSTSDRHTPERRRP